jgi:hypothetical protein
LLALAGLRASFSWFGLFLEPIFWYSPPFSSMQAGFSQFGILREMFVDLCANSEEKSVIPSEIQGIGARKFCGNVDQHTRHQIYGSKPQKLNKSRDQISRQLWGYFWIFEIFGGNNKSRVDPWQPKAADTI